MTRSARGIGAVLLAALVAGACRSTPAQAPSSERDAGLVDGSKGDGGGASDAGAPVLTFEAACALPIAARGRALPAARAFSRGEEGVEPLDSPRQRSRRPGDVCEVFAFCDSIDAPPKGDRCFVANENLYAAEHEALPGAKAAASPPVATAPSLPRYFDLVDSRFHLREAEKRTLASRGFVVPDRLVQTSYGAAYHGIFQEELPIFVTADSILHAVYKGNGLVLETLERSTLRPKLGAMLKALRGALRKSTALYDAETLADLDVFLTTAWQLLGVAEAGKEKEGSLLAASAQDVAALVAGATSGEAKLEEVSLFGRPRMIDFSQFVPRGHYASRTLLGDDLGGYFRAMMWLSRIEFNLVSRSCRSSQPGMAPDPSETPREARDAVALADLVRLAGMEGALGAFEETYRVFAGRREDVSVPELLSLAARAGLTPRSSSLQPKLAAAIGGGFVRTARIHYMPEGSPNLPVIATLMGPRIVPDTAPLTRLVHDAVPGRYDLTAADVGYVLGHDRANAYLAGDLKAHPDLAPALDKARADLATGLRGKSDLYALWLGAVRRLADAPAGVHPSFMDGQAYQDLRMNEALVGYGQLRHNYVLLAAQGYDAYGCEIPDGYVEPALATYQGLTRYAREAARLAPQEKPYFTRLGEVLDMLTRITKTELAGAPLTDTQKRWLGMVAEYVPQGGYGGDSGTPPHWTGWYFDLFPDREKGADAPADFVADYFTLTNKDVVKYLGASGLRLGVFTVDVSGERRLMVGPVASGYETESPIAGRLDDDAARKATGKRAPWTESYVVPAPAKVDVSASRVTCEAGDGGSGVSAHVRVAVESREAGTVSVELLGHHGEAITEVVSATVGSARPVALEFDVPRELAELAHGIEGAHVRFLRASAAGSEAYDVVQGVPLSLYQEERFDESLDAPGFPLLDDPKKRSASPFGGPP